METKKCTTCKIEQALSEYRKDASRSNGINPTCNNCNKEIQRKWYKNNKEKAKKIASKNYHKNKDLINTKRRQERINNPEEVRAKARANYNPIAGKVAGWKNAGIKDMTYERYLQMLESQKSCCAICGAHQDKFKRKLCVDHNHETGEARGLLCDACNGGIGRLKDSTQMLEKAIKYLKDYE
jgi:hypothetical protein